MTDNISQDDLKEFYNKGALAFEKKNYDYAIEIFSQILSSKYDHLEARRYLHLSLRNKAGDSAVSSITKALNSTNRLIMMLPVEAMLKKDKISSALENLEKILAKNPRDIEVLKKISDIFYKKGLVVNALQNLEEAKEIDPGNEKILKRLGELYLKVEDYKNGKANFEAALKINPNDTDVLKSLKNLDALGTIQKEFNQ
jgi:tetratricopeptide (TPR) repeat protein